LELKLKAQAAIEQKDLLGALASCVYYSQEPRSKATKVDAHVSAQSNVAARGDVVSAPHAVGEYDTNCTRWPSCPYSAYVHCLSTYVFSYNKLSADLGRPSKGGCPHSFATPLAPTGDPSPPAHKCRRASHAPRLISKKPRELSTIARQRLLQHVAIS
jgi:hypothetical protein